MELAKRAGITNATLNKLEKGKRGQRFREGLNVLNKIAGALGVSLSDICPEYALRTTPIFMEFAAAVIKALPCDLSDERMFDWILAEDKLKKALAEVLKRPK